MSGLTKSSGVQQIDAAVRTVSDTSAPIDDRAAVYGVLHALQLYINRHLRPVKDELIVHMEREGIRKLGPLSVTSSAVDVKWPCNAEGNWGDAGIQQAMRELYAGPTREYVRHVPEHYEIRTAELGAGVAAGDPIAKDLHAELKRRGWRTEEARRLSLKVDEARREEKAA